MKKKTIALLLVVTLLIGLVPNAIGQIAKAEGSTTGYTELSPDDFGVATYKEMATDGESIETATKASLDGVAITGVYNFKGAAQLFVGQNWYALTLMVSDNTLCVFPTLLDTAQGTQNLYIYASELGYEALAERNMEVRITFDFENIIGNKADVVVKVTVDDKVTKETTLKQATTTTLYQSIGVYLPDANSKVTITEPECLIKKLTMNDFGVETYKELAIDGESIETESKATLDGTRVTGVYRFQGSGQMFVGENWKAIQVSIYETTLCVLPYDLGNANTAALYFSASDFGYTAWTDRNVKLVLTFDFKNISGDKADVEVSVAVDDRAPKMMTLVQANTATLYQSIGVYLPDANSCVTVMTEEYAIEKLTVADFGVKVYKEMNVDGGYVQTESKASLDGVAITGIYNFKGAAQLFVGENWHALTLAVSDNTLCIYPTLLDTAAATQNLYFAASELGYTELVGQNIKLCVAFDFENIVGNKADVIVKVTVDDTVTKETTLKQATTTTLYQNIGVNLPDANSSVFIMNPNYKPETNYEEMSLKDFGISYFKNVTTDGAVFKTPSAATLDKVAVTGLYKLYGDAQFFIGESWKGLAVSVYENSLCVVPYALENTNTAALYFDCSEFGYTAWKERDVKVRAAFAFANVSGDKADVIVKITVDDKATKEMILENATTTALYQSIGVYLPNGDSKIVMTEPNPDPEPNYEQFVLKDYGFKGYTKVNDETVLKELSSEKILDGTMISGDYKFSPNQSIICVGGYWTGFRIQSLDNGKFEVRFQLDGVEQYVDDTYGNIIITPEAAGMTLTDRIINMKLGFEVVNEQGTMGDLIVRMTIDGTYKEQFMFEDIPLAYTKQIVMAWAGADGTLLLNATDPIPAVPTLNTDFQTLTFDSYLIYSDVYGYDGSNDLAVSGNCKRDNLDGVIFSDTLKFTDKPGAQLFLGGKSSGWEGLLLASAENGNLVMIYDGKTLTFTSKKAGVQLTDNDVKMTFSFEYVDADEDGKEDDVKLGVWFNGKAYNDEWIYLYDYAEKLGGYIGIYSAAEGASLTVTTYNAPIDFAEWGFTKDWAKTLGLK